MKTAEMCVFPLPYCWVRPRELADTTTTTARGRTPPGRPGRLPTFPSQKKKKNGISLDFNRVFFFFKTTNGHGRPLGEVGTGRSGRSPSPTITYRFSSTLPAPPPFFRRDLWRAGFVYKTYYTGRLGRCRTLFMRVCFFFF